MLDYYDRCYDHDLSTHAVRTVELGERSAVEGARLLLEEGWVRPAQGAAPDGSGS
jgi:tRNA 2-selenouridine synthase